MLTAAGVTCSDSAASVKLRFEATLSNTRKPFRGSLSNPADRLAFLNCRLDIAFADRAAHTDTMQPQEEVFLMKTSNLVALIIALAITTGGIEGINLLFAKAYSDHEREAAALSVRA
jgi:hypothetical protein